MTPRKRRGEGPRCGGRGGRGVGLTGGVDIVGRRTTNGKQGNQTSRSLSSSVFKSMDSSDRNGDGKRCPLVRLTRRVSLNEREESAQGHLCGGDIVGFVLSRIHHVTLTERREYTWPTGGHYTDPSQSNQRSFSSEREQIHPRELLNCSATSRHVSLLRRRLQRRWARGVWTS